MIQHLVRRLPRSTRNRLVPLVREGHEVEDWVLLDSRHGEVRPGEHWSLLLLLASLRDPRCVDHLRAAEELRHRLEALGVRLFGVAPGAGRNLGTLSDKLELGFPLCRDPELRLARELGAVVALPGLPPRLHDATVLLDHEGVVRFANRGLPSLQAVHRTLVALEGAAVVGRGTEEVSLRPCSL